MLNNSRNRSKEDDSEKMSIAWVLSKSEKMELLKKNQTNTNNVYTNNLKKSVTEEQLHSEFSRFGELVNVSIPPSDKPTNLAYISFRNNEDAREAIASAGKDKKILELYEKGVIFICYHQNKEQRQEYLNVVMKSKKKKMENKPLSQPLAYPPNPQFMMPQPPVYQAPQYQQPMQGLPAQGGQGGFPGQGGFQGGFPGHPGQGGYSGPNMGQNKGFGMGMNQGGMKRNPDQGPRKYPPQGGMGFQQGGPAGRGVPQQQQYRQKVTLWV